jgi:hypothetical protein
MGAVSGKCIPRRECKEGSQLGQSKLTILIRNAFRVASAKKEVKAYTDTRGRSALSAFRAAPPILPRNGRPKTEANHRRAHSALWPHILRRKVWLNTEAGQRRAHYARRPPSFRVTGVRRRKPITGERISPSGRTSCGVRYGSTRKPVSGERIMRDSAALPSENRRRTKTEKDQESFSCPGGGCGSFVGEVGNAGTTFLRLWRFLCDAKVLSAGRHSWGERLCLSGPGGMRHQSYPRG